MEFIITVFSHISSMPLFIYLSGAFVFSSVIFIVYRMIGVFDL